MELALFPVKNLIQGTTKTRKLYMGKILVAMDVTLQKIQRMLMITTLCLTLSEEDEEDEEELRRSRTKKLESLLGEEALKVVGELVSCQKILTGYLSSDQKPKEISELNGKAKLIRRLKNNREKQQFLLEVYNSTKDFIASMTTRPIAETGGADNEDSSPSTSPSFKIAPFNGVQTGTEKLSVVKLLRKALHSKYKRHVRRCFQELDVESLMNILYLVYEGSTKTGVSPETLSQFPSSLSDCEEYECFDLEGDETNWDMDKYFCDEEEINPFVMEKSHEEGDGPFFDTVEEFKSFMDNHDEGNSNLLVEELSSLSLKDVPLGTPCLDSTSSIMPTPTVFEKTISAAISRDIQTNNQLEMTSKIIKLQTTLLGHPTSTFTLEQDKLNNIAGHSQLNNLLHYYSQLRSIAQAILGGDDIDLVCSGGSGNRIYYRGLIDYKLLLIQERKLQSVYCRLLASREEQRRELDETVLRWTSIIGKATEEASLSVKSYIKENVTSETIQRKHSESEASKTRMDLQHVNTSLSETVSFVKSSTKSLRARRHYLEASLDALNRHYGSTMQKYQVKLDEHQITEEANKKATAALQKKFKHVEETYDEMRAMRRLKELLQNMQKAEAIKQNWAARKIQMQWRKYKLAKLRKKKLKGKKKGKKKTPPPQGKGSTTATPSKGSTPASRSRSKSQTP